MPLLIVMVAAVMISTLLLAGGGYYLAKSGRVALVSGTPAANAKAEIAAVPATHPVVLEPMVVNLTDEGGKAYLRIGITLRALDVEPKKDDKPKEEKPKEAKGDSDAQAAVRDTALEVLGRQTAEDCWLRRGKSI